MTGKPLEVSAKILVVDDSPVFRQLMGKILERGDYTVIAAPDAEDGIREARTSHPDLIILDVEMPGIDGLTACATITGDPELKHIPVIMLTATKDPKLNERAFRAGAAATIVKGSGADSLLNTVRLGLSTTRVSGA